MKTLSKTHGDWYGLIVQTDLAKDDSDLMLKLGNIISEDLQQTVNSRMLYGLNTTQKIFDYAKFECGLIRSKEITEHDNNKSIHALTEAFKTLKTHLDQARRTELADALQAAIAAPPPPRRPTGPPRPARPTRQPPSRAATPGRSTPANDMTFKGCWHCGIPGHSRGECRNNTALLKASGNRLPDHYKGAYEEWLEAGKPARAPPQRRSVNKLADDQREANGADSEDDDADDDGEPTAMLWKTVTTGPPAKTIAAITKPVATTNAFNDCVTNTSANNHQTATGDVPSADSTTTAKNETPLAP